MLDQGAPAGLRHFTCKFSHRVPLVQCPSEVIKKKRINLLMPLSPYRCFSSLSFCRLSALITIKEVYAHAAAIQKIIRSASIDLGHSYLCCKNASWSKLTVATCSHNVFRRGPFFLNVFRLAGCLQRWGWHRLAG